MKQYSRSHLWTAFYVLSSLGLTAAFFYGITEHNRRSVVCFAAAFILSFLGFLSTRILEQSKKRRLYQELLPVYILFSIFWLLCTLSSRTVKMYPWNNGLGLFCLCVPLVLLVIFFFRDMRQTSVIRRFLCSYPELWLLLGAFVLLSMPTLTSWTRLDTNIYYTYLQEASAWDMSFYTIEYLKLGDHQCYGYSIWGLIGIYLTPNSPAGVRCIDIVLAGIGILCFYAILKKLAFTQSRVVLCLLTALFACHPLILGIIYEINLDLPMTCFYLMALCFLIYDRRILFFFSAFFLVFSKEPGILLLGGIGVGWFLSQCVCLFKQYGAKALFHINGSVLIGFFYPLLILAATMGMGLFWRQEKSSLSTSDENTMERIGTDLANTFIKLKELFILNFAWLIVLCIVCAAVICLIKWRKNRGRAHVPGSAGGRMHLWPIVTSWGFFVTFQFVYITYCHIRYIMPYLVGLFAVLGVLLCKAVKKKMQILILGVLVCLMLIQSFYTLDPLSTLVCTTIDIGETTIYTTRTYARGINNEARTIQTDPAVLPHLYLTQSAIYNRQFLYFEDAFEEVLREISYDEHTFLAIAPIYNAVGGMTWTSLFGRWYSDVLYYDPDTYQVLDDERLPSLNLGIVNSPEEIDFSTYERVYLLSFSYNEYFDEEAYLQQFAVTDSFDVVEKFWEIHVYELQTED